MKKTYKTTVAELKQILADMDDISLKFYMRVCHKSFLEDLNKSTDIWEQSYLR